MIYCIQDYNPEQIIATGYVKAGAVLKAAMWMDKRSCRKSDLVITVGRDLVETLKKRFAGEKVPQHVMINNWIDEKEIILFRLIIRVLWSSARSTGSQGNIPSCTAATSACITILKASSRSSRSLRGVKTPDGRDVAFAFVGAGSVLDKLVMYVKDHGMDNIVFIPYQDKDKLIYSLNAADVHWCVNAKGIKGVRCPSNVYPILAVA